MITLVSKSPVTYSISIGYLLELNGFNKDNDKTDIRIPYHKYHYNEARRITILVTNSSNIVANINNLEIKGDILKNHITFNVLNYTAYTFLVPKGSIFKFDYDGTFYWKEEKL